MSIIGIIGNGAWATTMGIVAVDAGHDVLLGCRNADRASQINSDRQNQSYLPNISLSERIQATPDLDYVVQESSLLLLAIPSNYLGQFSTWTSQAVSKPIAILTKGLMESETGWMFISDYLERSGQLKGDIAVLSGPNIAQEIANHQPATTVIGCKNTRIAEQFQTALSTSSFRIYTSTDRRGVECGGILKNCLAIAAGAIDGLELGHNAKASFITRGIQEICRLGVALGGQSETFFGLSGLGDLIATCSSPLSRNWKVGYGLAKGESLAHIQSESSSVAEGIKTTRLMAKFATDNQIDTPMIHAIDAVLHHQKSPKELIDQLMNRPLKSENA